jgi:trk system potassium uptake protein
MRPAMNLKLLCKLLSVTAVLIGGTMLFSLPWALPLCGGDWRHERAGFVGLLASMAVCLGVAGVLRLLGRNGSGQLFRREAMAMVGLSWVLATLLGALPYLFSGTERAPGARMSVIDAMFEAQSGFTTTGATVLTNLEEPALVPRSVLFWRSSTHFLGGLGIIVLFVAILGQGSAGKALMQAEMPGPSKSSPQARMQHTAWVLFLVYVALNGLLAALLVLEGLSPFDALCHAFGTIATGGFSTYNTSVGHFATVPGLNAPRIEMTIVLFMILGATNFMLLYWVALGQFRRLLGDVEWRTYVVVLLAAVLLLGAYGLVKGDFHGHNGMTPPPPGERHLEDPDPLTLAGKVARFGLFNIVSITTTTGFCTDDFNRWNGFARALLLILMFTVGCSGSTSGGVKLIRTILLVKILRLEAEQAYHPTVVRPLRLGDEVLPDSLRKNILVYFALMLVVCLGAWLFIVAVEPDATWTDHGHPAENKLLDSFSAVAATVNTTGPGFGIVGATRNYSHLTAPTKLVLALMMLLGRLEVFVVVVLFVPSFWRAR